MKKFQTELKWAVYYGIALLAWMAIEKVSGLHDQYIDRQLMYTNLFGMIGLAVFYLAIRDKKMNYYNGQMLWVQGFISGVFLATFITVLSPVYNFIIYKFISPQYFDNMIRYVESRNLQSRENAESFFNLKSYILQSSLGGISLGIIASAIVSLILRNRKQP